MSFYSLMEAKVAKLDKSWLFLVMPLGHRPAGILPHMSNRYNYVRGSSMADLFARIAEYQEARGGGRIVQILWDEIGDPKDSQASYVAVMEDPSK